MARGSADDYGSFGSVPNETPVNGSGAGPLNLRAGPEDFGAAVGKGLSDVGTITQDVVQHYQQMATEAHANDVLANQFAPAAAKLSGDFYAKQGKDAVLAEPSYIQSLTDLRTQVLQNQTPAAQQILGQYMARHAAQETDGAARHAGQQQVNYENQASDAFVKTLSDSVVSNYNNPDAVGATFKQIDGQIQKHGMDRGEPQEFIDENQRQVRGKTVVDMIGRATAQGDIATANSIYSQNKEYVPGPQQLEIDKMLHSENMRVNGYSDLQAVKSGQPLSIGGVGHTVPEVQATVADAAQKVGIDPNHALTVASIESGFGQNVGKRGDIGQTGKPGDLPTQAVNLTAELKRSDGIADKALGRIAEPWEGYTCYQQGAGGGPALLRAATDDPTARAVEVLRPLYGSNKEALSAIVNNGGNASMTSGQFLDFIKQNYQAHAQRAQCDLPQMNALSGTASLPGATILASTKDKGMAVQPGGNPVEDLKNYNELLPGYIDKVNQIANLDRRNSAFEALKEDYSHMKMGAEAYKSTLTTKFQDLAIDPTFTSMNDPRLTPELRATFADDPAQLNMLRNAAKANLEEGSGTTSRTYGDKYASLFHDIKTGTISDPSQLDSYMGNGLTPPGLKELREEFKPENQTQQAKITYNIVEDQVAPKNALGERGVEGEKAYSGAIEAMRQQLSANRAKQISDTVSYNADPKNKDWIGNAAMSFQTTDAKRLADMRNGVVAPKTVDAQTLALDLGSGKLTGFAGATALKAAYKTASPQDKAALNALAIKYGYIQSPTVAPIVEAPRAE